VRTSLGSVRRTLLPLVLAALLTGCGSSGDRLLSERQADRLLGTVDATERAAAAGDCAAARQAAREGAGEAAGLGRVDRELRANLRDWFNHLADRVRSECGQEPEPEETASPEPTATATPEATATATPEPTATASPEPTATAEPPPPTGGVEPPPEDGVGDG
jgi:septal ring-binding cell division protein DamX